MPVQNAVTSSSGSLASCMLVELPIVEMYGDDNDDEAIVIRQPACLYGCI